MAYGEVEIRPTAKASDLDGAGLATVFSLSSVSDDKVALSMKTEWKQMIAKAGAIGTREFQFDVDARLEDLRAMALLPDLGLGYLPWSSFALRPSALTLVLNELAMNASRTVIECGVGLSTLYQLSPALGGSVRLVGIDDDAEWITLVRGYLDRMGVDVNRYRLIHAPIQEHAEYGASGSWYDMAAIETEIDGFLGDEMADLLLVDGPMGYLCDQSRYPALPRLRHFLKDDFAVILDDIHRQDERAIAQSWASEYRLNLRFHCEKAGVALLRPESTRKTRTVT